MQQSEQLLELYHLDRRLAFLAKRLDEIPSALAALEAEAERRGEASRRREQESAELAEALRRLEGEGASLRGELARLEKQQQAVTGMDALRASESQLHHCRDRLQAVEDAMLVKLEAQDIHSREGELRARREEEERSALATERQGLEAERDDCLRDQEQTARARETVLAALPDAEARRYRRIFGSHGHSSLVSLHGGGCGRCGAALPPQELLEVRSQGRVVSCQGCGRLVMNVEEQS